MLFLSEDLSSALCCVCVVGWYLFCLTQAFTVYLSGQPGTLYLVQAGSNSEIIYLCLQSAGIKGVLPSQLCSSFKEGWVLAQNLRQLKCFLVELPKGSTKQFQKFMICGNQIDLYDVRWSWVRALTVNTKPDVLSSIPRTYMVEGENQAWHLSSDLHICMHTP